MKKKIGILRYDLDAVGGAEKAAIELANALADEYDVHLIAVVGTRAPFFTLDERVKYTRLLDGKFNIAKSLFPGSRKLRRYLKEMRIDVLISAGISSNPFMAMATVGLNLTKVFCEHGNQKQNPTKLSRLNRWAGVLTADKIVTLTNEDLEHYKKAYPYRNDKDLLVIPNWIYEVPDNVSYDVHSQKLLTVGRFSPVKGYDMLAKVIVPVLQANPDWQWDIYGDGDSDIKSTFEQVLVEADIQEQVHFKGNVTGAEHIYPGHALCVMTSYYEGLPLVLLEASTYKIPCVSFKTVTGPKDIIVDQVNGCLVDNFDTEQMAIQLQQLMNDPQRRILMSEKTDITTEKFSRSTVLRQWHALLQSVTK